ncbi:MAG: TetR family transcriptional regulator [Pseudomonadota bacterium]
MATKSKSKKDGGSPRMQMIAAALELATEGEWELIGLKEIAEKADVDLAEAYELFDEKVDILAAYDRSVNRRAIENADLNENNSCREKIFDLLMERFDILNENRTAILNIKKSFKSDPKEALLSFPHLGKSMARLLDASEMSTKGITGALRVTGLMGLYLYTVKTWAEDESADLAKTMAALDKALDKCELFNNSILDKFSCSQNS